MDNRKEEEFKGALWLLLWTEKKELTRGRSCRRAGRLFLPRLPLGPNDPELLREWGFLKQSHPAMLEKPGGRTDSLATQSD